MFSNSHSAANQHGNAPSIISSDVVITGILQSDGDIQIDGRVEGNVRSAGLVIGERAVIHGEIHAEHVVVRGRVEGGIRAREVTLRSGRDGTLKLRPPQGQSFPGRTLNPNGVLDLPVARGRRYTLRLA